MTGVEASFMLNSDLSKGFVHKLINHHLDMFPAALF